MAAETSAALSGSEPPGAGPLGGGPAGGGPAGVGRPDQRPALKIAFVGGGTGGHLVPGIAVAEELARAGHGSLFLVAGREVERSLLEPRRLAWRPLFRGGGGRPSPLALGTWIAAAWRWRRALADFDPDVVVVLGGWVALPTALAGFGGRAAVLLEENARPGRVQRWLDGRVDHACLAVEADDMPRGRRSTRVTGNPVSPLAEVDACAARRRLALDPERRTLLLMGGSQGAADLNSLRGPLTEVLAARPEPWQVLHLTGAARAGVVTAAEAEASAVPIHERAFESDMGAAYAAADVAVCRAGASTVAELAASGTPAVLVPYPHHADRHQEANGQLLVRVGGARLVPRDDPTGRQTAPDLLVVVLDQLEAMTAAVRGAACPDAAREVAACVIDAAVEAGRC